MDALAEFAAAPPQPKIRKGPPPRCEIYGPGDPELYVLLHAKRHGEPTQSWSQVQVTLDGVLGITKPIHEDQFRYHWTGKCAHWAGVVTPG